MTEELPGLDLDRFGPWFAEEMDDKPGGGPHGPLQGRLLAGGKSNLTYEVGDGARTWVVRRPPLGHVLATAHDMVREHRVITALRDTAVPVPVTYAVCTDDTVIGAPFYVMERIVGTPYRLAGELAELGPERTRAIATGMVETLATLHEVDPATVGLEDFGRPEGFLERQVRRWRQQLDASHCRDLPAAEELHRLLAARQPRASPTGIVHGDYRLDNLLVDAEDRTAAVIDWEMATLGDPLTDLALLAVYQRLGDLPVDPSEDQDAGAAVADASSAPGFPSEAELLATYDARSHRDLGDFGFYLGLASFKLAVILEGIHYRHLHGQTVGSGFDRVGTLVGPLLDAGLTSLKEHR